MNRRTFMKTSSGAALGYLATAATAADSPRSATEDDGGLGCLVDTTLCVGCRECEKACNAANGNPAPAGGYGEQAFLKPRRPSSATFTVVNRYPGAPSPAQQDRPDTFAKFQCMHCLDPACVSACIVGALTRAENGAVIYDLDRCIGCRYCLVACPFQIPAYEYEVALTPRVRKCFYCFERISEAGGQPACAAACPREAIVFGKRADMLKLAKKRIEQNPARYLDHIYGEHEVGGTAWLYLAGRPFDEIGFVTLGEEPVPRLSESIQHGIFKYFAAPIGLYVVLGGIMWAAGRRGRVKQSSETEAAAKEGK